MRVDSVLVAIVLAASLAVAAQAQDGFTVTDLGGTYSEGFRINASGQVAGSTYVNGNFHAFLYSSGNMVDLGTLPGFPASYAAGINSSGQAVGASVDNVSTFNSQAFLYSGGTMTSLGTLLGTFSYARDINDLGQIVGGSGTGVNSHAFLYSGGAVTDLGTLGGVESSGTGINNHGQICGWSGIATQSQHAFLYSGGTMMDIGTLRGNTFSAAVDINDSGQVTGYSGGCTVNQVAYLQTGRVNCQGRGALHAFLYSGGRMIDLGTLPSGARSQGFGINNDGSVVGFSSGIRFARHAFLYSNGRIRDLNNLIPANSGWTLLQADGINDSGQITGQGLNPQQQLRAFLLTPAPTVALVNKTLSYKLPAEIANSLLAKLNAALSASPSNAGCADLSDFIWEVQLFSGDRLRAAQANQLIAAANQVKASLDCP